MLILSVVFLFLHLQTDNQLAKHCIGAQILVIVDIEKVFGGST